MLVMNSEKGIVNGVNKFNTGSDDLRLVRAYIYISIIIIIIIIYRKI